MKYKNVSVNVGLMITERCNLKCDHCMFSCTTRGKDMSDEVIKAASNFIDSVQCNSINVYGGEPFLNIDLFDKVFKSVYDPDKSFFVSTNGTFMSHPKSRDYVWHLMNKLRHNYYAQDGVSRIRVSYDRWHAYSMSEKQKDNIKVLRSLCSDPYEWYYRYVDDIETCMEENPFEWIYDNEGVLYVEPEDNTYNPNPSGRAIDMCNCNDTRCFCVMTTPNLKEELLSGEYCDPFQLNIRPNGDIDVCCRCKSCVVGNVLKEDISLDRVIDNLIGIREFFREYKGVDSSTRMWDICPLCAESKKI